MQCLQAPSPAPQDSSTGSLPAPEVPTADAAEPAQAAQQVQPLGREECSRYAQKIGRFLGCGEGSEESVNDRPTHLVARAALNR